MYRAHTLVEQNRKGNMNVVDFNFGDKTYYGKVDENFSPVYLPQRQKFDSRTGVSSKSTAPSLRLKAVTSADSQRPQYAIDFVADIFEEMRLQFELAAARGQINKNHPFLSNLKVYKSYSSVQSEYKNYKTILFQTLKRKLKKSSTEITNFDDFMSALMAAVPTMVRSTPFTFAGYIKSNINTVMTSGFALEIADMSKTNDAEKISMFYKSSNWDFFVNACNKYGFMIDYNCPWRIVNLISNSLKFS